MITVEHLTKYYGNHLAVDDLSFEIPGGHVYGFLGPNGAGKSTTMNIMTGCLSASDGTVKINGHDIFEEPREAKRLIGYLPEQPPLYMNETPVDYLTFVGRAKGLRGKELEEQIREVIELTGIEHVKGRRIAALSKGYKQRVGIAQALLGKPEVIILDEPTVGLDPLQIIEIRDLIKSLGEKHTVIFSSHILSEVQTICDEILMIAHGKLVAFDTPEKLEKQFLAQNEILITTDAAYADVLQALEGVEGVSSVTAENPEEEYLHLHITTDLPEIYDLSRILFGAFANSNVTILEMNLKKANLEDLFIELAENRGQTETINQTESEAAAAESETVSVSEDAVSGETPEDRKEEGEQP